MSTQTATRRRTAPRPRGRGAEAERLRARPARARLLEAARELAEEQGYERVEAGEITRRAELSHETFYTHFADKRQCLIEACVPRLIEIDLQVREAVLRDDPWAGSLRRALEESLGRLLGGAESVPRMAARAAFEAVAQHGYAAVKIGEIAVAADISKAAFYRHFRGKADCFALGYAEALASLEGELRGAGPEAGLATVLSRLGERLAADPARATTLVSEIGRLSPVPPSQEELAWRGSLVQFLERFLAAGGRSEPGSKRLRMAAGTVLEIWRTAAVTGCFGNAAEPLEGVAALIEPALAGPGRPVSTPPAPPIVVA